MKGWKHAPTGYAKRVTAARRELVITPAYAGYSAGHVEFITMHFDSKPANHMETHPAAALGSANWFKQRPRDGTRH